MKKLGPRVALVGKSGAGKSAVGDILAETYGYDHVRTGVICRTIAKLLFGNEDKATTQRLDDVLLTIDESIFLKAAIRNLDTSRAFVLDALRFESDLSIARSMGCSVVQVVAPEQVRVARLSTRGQQFDLRVDGVHRSETELDSVVADFVLVNEGSRDELRDQLAALL